MSIEQLPPRRPNSTRIFILVCIVLAAAFIITWIFIHFNAGNLRLRHQLHQPHSHLVLPTSPSIPQVG